MVILLAALLCMSSAGHVAMPPAPCPAAPTQTVRQTPIVCATTSLTPTQLNTIREKLTRG